jgi:hypothetical protein
VGDFVFTADGRRLRIAEVQIEEVDRPMVSVGLGGDQALYANGILVHDQCGWWIPPDDPPDSQSEEVAP